MAIKEAKRKAVPLMISLAGTSGSGKTYSALLLASGLAGVGGKVGFLDTESGRGSMYADDEEIISAMPKGKYFIDELNAPFSPSRYQKSIQSFIDYGVSALVIDSTSHAWEGDGGCCDIAEQNKLAGLPNWAKAKMEHKKLMNMLTQCPMHIIFCLRAREKSKPIKVFNERRGKMETKIVEEGMQPIQEKNFMYEMTLSVMLGHKAPGKPVLTKCPKPLLSLFTGNQALINKEVGVKLKQWADDGESVDVKIRNLKRECRDAASFGRDILNSFFSRIKKEDKDLLTKLTDKEFREEMQDLALQADRVQLEQDEQSSGGAENKLNLTN